MSKENKSKKEENKESRRGKILKNEGRKERIKWEAEEDEVGFIEE